ncbi:MAG: hypothetical protein AABY22_27705, partial [Nanoarchaeota archaeon]
TESMEKRNIGTHDMKITKTDEWIEYKISPNRFVRKYIKDCSHPISDSAEIYDSRTDEEYFNCKGVFYSNEICWFYLNQYKRISLHNDNGPSDYLPTDTKYVEDTEYTKYWYFKGSLLYENEEKYWNK